jgi:hypothetical protein
MPAAIYIQHDGVTLSAQAWAAKTGLASRVILSRRSKGWPAEKILATDLPRYPRKHREEAPAWRGGRTILWPDNYVGIFMPGHPRANKSGYVREHIVVAERSLGKPLPCKALVHHVNEIQDDNRNANLVICQDAAYHKLLHVRMRVRAAGGNPNTDKICGSCRQNLPLECFSRLKRSSDGLGPYCRECLVFVNRRSRERFGGQE